MDGRLVTAIGVDGPAAELGLTPEERRLCSTLPFPGRRRDFRAGRLAAKRAIRGVLGSATQVEVLARPDGAPELVYVGGDTKQSSPPVCVSISHKDGRAVAAAAPQGVRVGVDLERSYSVTQDMADFFLNAEERPVAPFGDLTILWSLKEAVWKALQIERSVPFKAVRLATGSDGGLLGAHLDAAYVPLKARLSFPWAGYHMATVWTEFGEA